MAVYTIGINPAVFIESYQPDPSPKWIGKVANSESNETYSLDQAAFELSEGVIALRLAAGVSRSAEDSVFELPVGHALTQVLQVGDRLELRHGRDGDWTYWVVRNDLLIIAVGSLNGNYGSNVEIHWHKKGDEMPKMESQSLVGKIRETLECYGYSHAVVQLANQKFELRDQEEIVAGPYYAKCLHLGCGGIPGHRPRVGILATSRLEIRSAFSGFFLFQNHLTKKYMEISNELFQTLTDPQKRKPWPPGDHMEEQNKRLREQEVRLGKLYLAFGMRPPQSRWERLNS
jgi:hypothetical protein